MQPFPQLAYRNEAQARWQAGLDETFGLAERLVWFWSNHFCVSVAKGQPIRVLAGPYEREAIRPHIFGKFSAMLRAVQQHPAMLIYLDNRQSIGPNSRAGTRRGRGLNENLAREILELHTLGVGGGYSQNDVTSLAKMLTGWTVVGPNDEDGEIGHFRFNANRHEPGDQPLMGKSYRDEGVRQAERALEDIARHPSTALFIARKLVRHFIADDPPKAVVDTLAEVFRKTEGDLAQVTSVLAACDDGTGNAGSQIAQPAGIHHGGCAGHRRSSSNAAAIECHELRWATRCGIPQAPMVFLIPNSTGPIRRA